jgi:hypothetical protein
MQGIKHDELILEMDELRREADRARLRLPSTTDVAPTTSAFGSGSTSGPAASTFTSITTASDTTVVASSSAAATTSSSSILATGANVLPNATTASTASLALASVRPTNGANVLAAPSRHTPAGMDARAAFLKQGKCLIGLMLHFHMH